MSFQVPIESPIIFQGIASNYFQYKRRVSSKIQLLIGQFMSSQQKVRKETSAGLPEDSLAYSVQFTNIQNENAC